MTKDELISKIAKREGKKSQVKIGDIREIVSIIEELEAEYEGQLAGSPLALLAKGSGKKKLDKMTKKAQKKLKKKNPKAQKVLKKR